MREPPGAGQHQTEDNESIDGGLHRAVDGQRLSEVTGRQISLTTAVETTTDTDSVAIRFERSSVGKKDLNPDARPNTASFSPTLSVRGTDKVQRRRRMMMMLMMMTMMKETIKKKKTTTTTMMMMMIMIMMKIIKTKRTLT